MRRYKRRTQNGADFPWDSQAEMDLLRHFCRDNFWAFFLYAFGAGRNPKGDKWIDESVHRPLAEWFEYHVKAWEAERAENQRRIENQETPKPMQRKLAVVIPRELGKTTMITQAGQLWLHLRDPEMSTYTGSERTELSQKILEGVKAVLDGSDPYAMFPKLYGTWSGSARKWTGKEITHAARRNTSRKDPSFGTFAVETSIVGAHPDAWFEDDPISYERLTSDSNWLGAVNSQVVSMVPVVQSDGLIVWPGCIAVGTPVLMSDGTWKPIQDVVAGDHVYTTDENGVVGSRMVQASLDQGFADTVIVSTSTGNIRCTPWHPFLSAVEGRLAWVRADALKNGDLVASVKRCPSNPEHEWMTEDLAWLCGFILGDGWIGKNADYACIARSKDEALNERVVSILEDWVPGSRFHQTAFGYVRCNSRSAAEAFRSLGLTGGAKSKRVPVWVFRDSETHRVAFLRGFCQADGSKTKRGTDSWEIEVSNSELVSDLRLLARTCGVRVGQERKQRERWIKPPNSREAVFSVTANSHFNFSTISEDERYFSPGTGTKRYRMEDAAARRLGDTFRLDRVKSVERSDGCQVWDLTVEGSRSFVCNGFVVHNTRYDDSDHFGTAFSEEGVASVSGMTTDSIVVDPENGQWHVYFLAARDKDNQPTAPKVWPEVRLAAYQRRDPLRYASQVMNDPSISEHNPITRDQIQQCKVQAKDVPWTALRYAICCDTAFFTAGQRASKDETVFIVHGYPRNGAGDVYVVEVHGSPTWRAEDYGRRLAAKVQQYRKQGRRVFAITDEMSPGKTEAWKIALRNFFHDANEPMPQFIEYNRNKGPGKVQRMVTAATYWVDGHVRWVEGAPGVDRLVEQMAKIGQMMVNPKMKDDYADAHADAFQPELYTPMRRAQQGKPPWERGATAFDTPGLNLDEFDDSRGEIGREPLQPLR